MGRVEKTLDLCNRQKYCIEMPLETKISISKIHGIGQREVQQDSFGISEINISDFKQKGMLIVLADGMGGMQGGEKASVATVISCLEYFDRTDCKNNDKDRLLQDMLFYANGEVRRALGEEVDSGGSTAVIVWLDGRKLRWITIGDSRLYLYRKGLLIKLNEEHIYATSLDALVKNGELTFEAALNDPQRDALTSYLGIKELKQYDQNLTVEMLQKGDKLVLMSDGVYNTVSMGEMIDTLSFDAENAAVKLENQIVNKRIANQDNYTAVIIEILE